MADKVTGESLLTTEENIREMEKILHLLDEIDEIKKKDPSKVDYRAVERATGGLTRGEIQSILIELKMKRADLIKKAEKPAPEKAAQPAARVPGSVSQEEFDALKAEINRLQGMVAKNAAAPVPPAYVPPAAPVFAPPAAPVSFVPAARGNAFEGFKEGDNALVLEGMYNGIADELEKMRDAIRQELGFAYQQEMAIYNDLSEQIAALGAMDPDKLAEKITEVSQLKSTDIKVLEDKLARAGEIDYDALAEKLAEKMGGVPALPGETEDVRALKGEIDELKAMLGAFMQSRDNSEFGLLDYEVSEYLKSENETALTDLLVEARDLKLKAQKFLDNGNTLRGKELLDGIRHRLRTVAVHGSEAALRVQRVAETYRVPLSVSAARLRALAETFKKYEQASILPDDEMMNEIIRAKRDAIKDPDLTVFDKQTFVEISNLGAFDEVSDIDEETAGKLRALKLELMSFTLASVFDFEANKVGAELTDTDLLLAEIKSLRDQISRGVPAAPAAAQTADPLDELSSLTEELTDIVHRAGVSADAESKRKKAGKVFRPAVAARDSKVEKKAQPLAVRKNKIKLTKDESPDSLANLVVRKVAENVAKTRIK